MGHLSIGDYVIDEHRGEGGPFESVSWASKNNNLKGLKALGGRGTATLPLTVRHYIIGH